MDIAGTVDKLIKLESGVLDNLKLRTEKYQNQQKAYAELSSLFMTSSFMMKNLGKVTVFDRRDVTSSNDSLLSATRNGNPPLGSYSFTPIRLASKHELLSSGVANSKAALGITGSVTARYGRNLETNFDLKNLNGGDGFQRGQIRITDRSGDKATIDLRTAATMNDVLDAINNNSQISVRAELEDDHIKLIDVSGQTAGNLIVQEVGGGGTAASLGLAGINVADNTAEGAQIVRLGQNLSLSALNDGIGFECNSFTSDLKVVLSDGTTASIDFSKYTPAVTGKDPNTGATTVVTPESHADEMTVGDLIKTITNNGSLKGKLDISISDDGKSLVWKDLTYKDDGDPSNDGPYGDNRAKFSVMTENNSSALFSLGLVPKGVTAVSTTGDTIPGSRIIGGLNTVLLRSLDGGSGIMLNQPNDQGQLASQLSIAVKDLAGNQATLNFTDEEVAGIETLDQYVKAVNDKLAVTNVKLKVQLNSAKTGLEIADSSNGTGTGITFKDLTGQMASAMNLTYNDTDVYSKRASQSLNLQVISERTLLSDFNGGRGIDTGGSIQIIDSKGNVGTFTMTDDIKTVGDLIRGLKNTAANVIAEINPSGDGIRLVDIAGGTGTLGVQEGSSYSHLAADLHFNQASELRNIQGTERYTINGSMTYNIPIEETDTLETIADKLNKTGMGISVSIFNDGSTTPYRLLVNGNQTGEAGHLTLDLSALGMKQEDVSKARSAILVYGDPSSSSSTIISSNSNTITNVVNGINLELKGTSTSPVTISAETSSLEIKTSLKSYIENINKFIDKYKEVTASDPQNNTYEILFGDPVIERLYTDLGNMLTQRIPMKGGVESLMQLGIKINPDTRQLEFDESKFDALYKANPDGIKEFFTLSTTTTDKDGKEVSTPSGYSAMYDRMSESYTAVNSGILGLRYSSLEKKVQDGNDRADFLQARLDAKRLLLYKQFTNMEQVLAKHQQSMNAVDKIGASSSSS
ncbi:MAG: flagellar filament capping protein FliD [Planctomycetaceae bacterium]|nr:flagellar filament capping protein FliD [Planctomycetaceae bacterium]